MKKQTSNRKKATKKSSVKYTKIVNAAAEVFREKGYKEATLEDIANKVGMLKGSLYYYIDKKDDLLYAVVERPLSEMTENLKQIVHSSNSPSTKLEQALKNHINGFERYQSELFVWVSIEWFKSEFGGEIATLGDEYDRLFRTIINEGIEKGEFRSDLDPKLMTFAVFGVYNYMQRWYAPNNEYSLEDIACQFNGFVLQGVWDKALLCSPENDEK
ncbi:TetR/AcrR family transcriptional regulator [Desertibacillus haloalkaliphilus]|uniref:TetR/AcrR family transcriptional regulator n=1 Tax=Desertibacillus haloalkaliphilus TaxID=1328930 RepID=UPI001C269149|nr:TetR/AcrR family transcriptional regulator [Desertibacillus haloalkaliphilus]MBU8906243.1 TetR/AcrR family transcriptional regulator [Desertibacillus haloalkaliphilus]